MYRSKRNLQSMLSIVAVSTGAGIMYETSTTGTLTVAGPLVGLVVGLPLALFEVLFPMNFMQRWSFAAAVFTKAAVYLALILFVFLGSTFIFGYFQGLTLDDFTNEIWSDSTISKVAVASVVFIVVIFFRQLNRLLGPGNLARYLFGRYHRPGREERIFMFLDLKGSTSIAERLDVDTYYSLINDFFHDIAEPILATKAQIYQYVGDEVVLTWPMEIGLENANCIRAFMLIDATVNRRADYYMEKYGLVPEYKAGLNGGEVIRAEIGDLKRELIFNGDVLNTAARIQSECNRFNARLLASASLVKKLVLPGDVTAEDLGEIVLKGKVKPIGLVKLIRTSGIKQNQTESAVVHGKR